MQGLYVQDGDVVVTHSMLKTFKRCPMQADYKYAQRLKPKRLNPNLKRGQWIHEVLEIFHKGGDWRAHHEKLAAQFNQMFDEERDYYGNMPEEVLAMAEAYIWHYKLDPWETIETEGTLEARFPDGSLYRGKFDWLIENESGIWLVDHKSHKTLPDLSFRLRDPQSMLYVWAAKKNKIPVKGFIWNYLRWKVPTKPEVVYKKSNNPRFSKTQVDTDYPTYYRALKEARAEYPNFRITEEYKDRLARLKAMRYSPGAPQDSPFFRRVVLERDDDMIRRVVRSNYFTAKRMNAYPFGEEYVERVVNRSCNFECSYTDLCNLELMGGDTRLLRRQNYKTGDPNDYYYDRDSNNKGLE